MLMLAAAAADDELDALERAVESRLATAGGDEAAALRARLDSLRALRREQAETIRQMREQMRDLARQIEAMSPDERLLLAFTSAGSTADIMRLVAGTADDALDRLEAAAGEKLAVAEGDERDALQRRLTDLRRWRAAERDARRTLAPLGDDGARALADQLIAWIETPDWAASEAFLREHASGLLTAEGAAAMTLLHMRNAGHAQVELHARLLAACREHGIEAAYAQLRREMAAVEGLAEAARAAAESPLLQAIGEFINATTDSDARRVLEQRHELLLTAEARTLLEQLVAAAQGQDDAIVDRLRHRLTLWQEAWRRRVGGPLRPRDRAPWEQQPEVERFDRLERQSLAGERGARYHVVTAVNCAIGDNDQTLNIYNVGDLPLAWSRPLETHPGLTRSAVGRAADLEELHRRLQSGGDVALVGVRGIAGIGKTVLAAMYATRYADHFPGGVIWTSVGPQVRTRNDVTPLLKHLAGYAYNRDVRVAWLDEIVFTPDAVQMLLGGHGRLLLVFDDVWTEEVAKTLKDVAPPGSAVLLTTRYRPVAYALGDGPDAIQELDVLSAADARALLQRRAPG
ncbi:MAG: NB-ARC domain-containing protein, partial [Anaerolineae bacterium]|nr:NB-ARC domain-containing protein [Anaerolineae bacterium]